MGFVKRFVLKHSRTRPGKDCPRPPARPPRERDEAARAWPVLEGRGGGPGAEGSFGKKCARRVGAAVSPWPLREAIEARRAPLCNLCSSNPAHLVRADIQVEAIWYTRIPLFLHDRGIQFCPIPVLTHRCTRPGHMCVYPGPSWPSVLYVEARFCISGPTTAL